MKHKLRQCQCCHSWLQFNQITIAHPLLGDQMTNIYRNPQIVSIQECTVTSSLSIKRLTKWTGENFADVTTSITNKKVIKINKESHICLIQYKLIEAKKTEPITQRVETKQSPATPAPPPTFIKQLPRSLFPPLHSHRQRKAIHYFNTIILACKA